MPQHYNHHEPQLHFINSFNKISSRFVRSLCHHHIFQLVCVIAVKKLRVLYRKFMHQSCDCISLGVNSFIWSCVCVFARIFPSTYLKIVFFLPFLSLCFSFICSWHFVNGRIIIQNSYIFFSANNTLWVHFHHTFHFEYFQLDSFFS